MPPLPPGPRHAASFVAAANNHYFAPVTINGVTEQGMIDTGASTIAMSPESAKHFGIDASHGKQQQFQTANGKTIDSVITVPKIQVGGLVLRNVMVSVGSSGPILIGMSSDFLSRPCEAERFALIYAHAQKNIGPAGVTVVVLREDFLGDRAGTLPPFLDYRAQIDAHSIYNTPPVFAIYAVLLVTRWLKDTVGGLAAMDALNRDKAGLFYGVLDDSDGFYRGHVRPEDRSLMNVAFTLGSPEQDRAFLTAAEAAGFSGLGGHRSLGGLRASLYNGLTREAVARLAQFMTDYRQRARA